MSTFKWVAREAPVAGTLSRHRRGRLLEMIETRDRLLVQQAELKGVKDGPNVRKLPKYLEMQPEIDEYNKAITYMQACM